MVVLSMVKAWAQKISPASRSTGWRVSASYDQQLHIDHLESKLVKLSALASETGKARSVQDRNISELLLSVQALAGSTKAAAEHLDGQLYERTGSIAVAIDVLRQAQVGAIKHHDTMLYEISVKLGKLIESQEIQSNRLLGRISNVATTLDQRTARSDRGLGSKLYLDLLEAELTGTLHSDVSAAPWAKDKFDAGRREIGRDWPKTALTMIGSARIRNLRQLCERALSDDIPGDFIETGVWRGGACIYMKGMLAAYGDTSRRVFVADSFKGLPPPDQSFPSDAGDQHHLFEQLAVARDEVQANFARFGLLDERVVFLEGWFKDTLPLAPIERLAVLRLDGDMYESTIQALDALYPKVSPGGFVIIDDYVLPPCAEAVNDYRRKHGIAAPIQEVDGAAVWWQVPI